MFFTCFFRYLALLIIVSFSITGCGSVGTIKKYPMGKPLEVQFFEAAQDGDFLRFQSLLDRGVAIDTRDKYGDTALHVAFTYGNFDIGMALLNEELDVNIRGFGGNAPIQTVMSLGTTELIKEMIKMGADVNAVNDELETPLFTALKYNRIDVMELLLDNGANIHHQNENGQTLLHRASNEVMMYAIGLQNSARSIQELKGSQWKTYKQITKMLLKRGINPHIRDGDGYTALDYAVMKGHREVIKILYPYFSEEDILSAKNARLKGKDNESLFPFGHDDKGGEIIKQNKGYAPRDDDTGALMD